jgi:tetratricopeptide (TPR) repeat protein
LSATPLAHLMLYVFERRLSGTLELRDADRSARVLFADGSPKAIEVVPSPDRFGDIFAEVTAETGEPLEIERYLTEARRTGQRIGRYLLGTGKISPGLLERILRTQSRRQLLSLFGFSDAAAFSFYDGHDLLKSEGLETFDLHPYSLVWAGVRQRPHWASIQATLGKVAGAAFRLAATASTRTFDLDARDQQRIALLAEARTLLEFRDLAQLGLSEAQVIIYVLLITKQVEASAAHARSPAPAAVLSNSTPPASGVRPSVPVPASPPTARLTPREQRLLSGDGYRRIPTPAEIVAAAVKRASIAPPPSAGQRLSLEDQARVRQIKDTCAQLESKTYFELLGLAKDATQSNVQLAYLGLVKQWHPDRLPKALEAYRGECSQVFAKIAEAHAVLSDVSKRQTYEKSLAETGGASEASVVQKTLEALALFQKAEAFVKKGESTTALDFAKMAVSLDETQADYLALAAWLAANEPKGRSPEATTHAIEELTRALKISPQCEKALFYRGLLYKRAENMSLAVRDFRAVVQQNPKHLDAVRELRVFQMRGGAESLPPPSKRPKTAEQPGIFGKLFKK